MKKVINWLSGLFDSESTISSKRFVLILMTIWALGFGGFYILMVQFGGKESVTTVGLIEFGLGSAITLAVGGTTAEAIKKRYSQIKEEKDEPAEG